MQSSSTTRSGVQGVVRPRSEAAHALQDRERYYAKGDYKGAIEHYQKYLTADPDGPFAAQAIEFSTIADKALATRPRKQQAAIDAARVEAERKTAEAGADGRG